jgi:hypothetical protein
MDPRHLDNSVDLLGYDQALSAQGNVGQLYGVI